jgi:hypothetical protein
MATKTCFVSLTRQVFFVLFSATYKTILLFCEIGTAYAVGMQRRFVLGCFSTATQRIRQSKKTQNTRVKQSKPVDIRGQYDSFTPAF